jgi:hypothetical protein
VLDLVRPVQSERGADAKVALCGGGREKGDGFGASFKGVPHGDRAKWRACAGGDCRFGDVGRKGKVLEKGIASVGAKADTWFRGCEPCTIICVLAAD